MAMEFSQVYSEFNQSLPPAVPTVSLIQLSHLLHKCPEQGTSTGCAACDSHFFPRLMEEMTSVLKYFNSGVQLLLRIHLATGVTKCMLRLKMKRARNYLSMIQEGQRLMKYVSMNSLATRHLLEKYDKVHNSREGSKFRVTLVTKHVEALKSPWLVELLALYFNLKQNHSRNPLPEICSGCVCDLHSAKPLLSCILHESLKLEVDVTCSICLDLVFEPVALKCGHIFCFKCACAAASVCAIDDLEKVKKSASCPLCRETGAFSRAIYLRELSILISRRCKDYCKSRFLKDRKQHLKQVKQLDNWSYMLADPVA